MNVNEKLLYFGLLLALLAVGSTRTLPEYVRTIKNRTPYPLNYKVMYYGGGWCFADTSYALGPIYPGEKRSLSGGYVC